MPTPADHEITRIYGSLQLELIDRQAEQERNQVDLFFDTFDVITAVIGLHEYTVDAPDGNDVVSKEKLDDFHTPAALVDCLLAGGWLGTFHLLPPHQAEFLRKLDNRNVFQRVKWPDKRIPDFLHAVGIHDEGERVVRLESMNEDERRKFIRKQADSAVRFFKAFQCVREPWWKRLNRWRGTAGTVRPLLDTTLPEIDYRSLIATPAFSDILQQFEKDRQTTQTAYGPSPASVNNLADAVALAMLIELTRRFNAGESKRLPRFFDSRERFSKVAQKAKVDAQLRVKVGPHEPSSVLVGADYLIYKATFRGPPAERGTGRSTPSSPVGLQEIHDAIGRIVGKDPAERLRALDRVQLSDGRSLGESITELLRLSFLRNVWLSALAESELIQFAVDYQMAVKEMATEDFKAQVLSEIAATKAALKHDAEEYKRLSTAWIELQRGVLQLRRSGCVSREPQFDLIRDLKLVRFVLPPNVQERVRQMMRNLLDTSIEDRDITGQNGWRQLVDAYFGIGLENAQLAAAALWPMQAYRSIVDLLHNLIDKCDDHSIHIIYAAACIELGDETEINRSEKLLSFMVESFRRDEAAMAKEVAGAVRLGQRAIGIAYLYFHIWQKRDYKAKWREFDDGTTDDRTVQDEELGRSLIASAVEFARKADRYFRSAERHRLRLIPEMRIERVYAANLLLYYLVEQGDPGQEKAMEAAARALEHLKERWRDAWQSTFDDSLARHHHFLASRSRDMATWEKLIEQAIRYSTAAVKGDPADSQASQYHALLVRETAFKTLPR